MEMREHRRFFDAMLASSRAWPLQAPCYFSWVISNGVTDTYISKVAYETAEEAARVYDTAARTHYGEFARLNFPEGTIQGFLPTAKKRIKTSQYRGVQKRNLFWRAILVREGKNVHLGDCESEEAAARLYDQAVIEHYGTDDPRMKLNFPLDL